jgi:hypothetical protein
MLEARSLIPGSVVPPPNSLQGRVPTVEQLPKRPSATTVELEVLVSRPLSSQLGANR